MASLPSATTRVDDESGGLATGTDLLCVFAPVATLDDEVPRFYASSQSIYDAHGYSPALSYAATHFQETKKPVLFVPLTIGTAGTVGRFDVSGNTGTSVVSIAVGANGSLEETEGELVALNSGTVGTDQLRFNLTLDGGRTWVPIRIGTASSYAIPYVGLTISLAGGTIVEGDTVLTWTSSAPKALGAAITSAKTKLAAQQRQCRRWLLIGDCSLAADVSEYKTAVDAYESTDERYVLAQASTRKRLPAATLSGTTVRMVGSPTLTFANSGDADTITRSSGSFIADGFVAGDLITVTGATNGANNVVEAAVVTVAALSLTFGAATTLTDEGPTAACVLTGTPSVTFAEAGAADTITLSRGSWYADGFRTGDIVTISGSASNDITTSVAVTITSATVMTLNDVADDLAAEVIGANNVSIAAGETDAQCIATLDAAFATVTSDKRVELGYGHGGMRCPVTGWKFRRPVKWAENLVAFKRDIGKTSWEKDYNGISRLACGFDLTDADGQPYEHDERTTGGALDARFTCARTWGNGPVGAFIAQAVTRADDGSILGMSHNVDVSNLAQTICQATTENFAGSTLVLEPADALGKRVATDASLKAFEQKVNAELERYLLSNIGGEGPRASVAQWTAATDDDLGVADATLHGSLDLQLNGTLVHISTVIRVK